jgi:hypothetical protein
MNWWVAPAGVGPDQDRLLLPGLSGELGEREVDHVDLVGGGVLAAALPGRRIAASGSPVPSPRSSQAASGWNPKLCL